MPRPRGRTDSTGGTDGHAPPPPTYRWLLRGSHIDMWCLLRLSLLRRKNKRVQIPSFHSWWAAQRAVPPLPGQPVSTAASSWPCTSTAKPPRARWSRAAHTQCHGSLPHTVHWESSAGSSPSEGPRHPRIVNSCLRLLQNSLLPRNTWQLERGSNASGQP